MKLLLLGSLVLSLSAFANDHTITMTVEEVSSADYKSFNSGYQSGYQSGSVQGGYYNYNYGKTVGGATGGGTTSGTNDANPAGPYYPGGGVPGGYNPGPIPRYSGEQGRGFEGSIDNIGSVISTARDIVALGETIYSLVQKGKPSNITEYAPISVVPRDPLSKEYVDPFDLEGFSMPVERSFVTTIKNGGGKTVVKFSYKVIYSYGGSFNGSGKYLTNVIIIPGSVKTSFGWDFNASMKLSGIMNHGSKADPVAGVMVTIKYQMNSWSSAFERNDTIHVTGRGEFKSFLAK